MLTAPADRNEPTDDIPEPPVPTATGFHDEAAQRDWENYQVTRGVWRYQRSLKREVQRGARKGQLVARGIGDLEPGQRIADELIVPLTTAVALKQQEARDAIASPNLKKIPDDFAALLLLPAEVLAVVTVLAALSRAEPAGLQSCATDLGGKIQREVALRAWKKAEKEAEEEREETDAPWEPNLYDLMVKRNDKVDERVFTKWSKKAKRFVHEEWEQPVRTRVGMALISLIVAVDGWFEVAEVRDGLKTKLMFQLTDLGRAFVAQRHNQNELARPFMLPMICEPKDYVYLPSKQIEEPEDPSCADD
ncbi:hypothetical protein [Rhizobacter sp. Root1221]|uniref:hypothetical protein n=1 Tax=Rhizobacter sp. Root1221 TaxID=1736433 RepID=UPI000702214A|nr:hypothetical protein [Rhizobacter sp. Root1221]